MSDDKPKSKAAEKSGMTDATRRAQTLDLDKSAVTDLTGTETGAGAGASPVKPPASAADAAQSPAATGADAPLAETPPRPEIPRDEIPRAEPPLHEIPRGETPVAERRGSGVGGTIGGALAGALFGVLGAFGYQHLVKPPATVAAERFAQLEAMVAATDRKAAEAAAAEARVKAEIARLEARAAQIDQRVTDNSRKAEAIDQRASGFEQRTAAAQQKAEAADQKAGVIEQRAAGFEQRATLLIVPVEDRIKALEARLVEAREQVAQMNRRVDLLAQIEPPKVDLRPVTSKIDELERAIAGTSARVVLNAEASAAFDGRIKTVEAGVKGIEGVVKGLEAGIRDLGTQQKAVQQSIADLGSRQGADPSRLLGIAALARRALDQGEPLGQFSSAMANLGVAGDKLQPLAAYAGAGAPSAQRLADLYAELAAKLPKPAPAPAPADTSFWGRVSGGLMSQVDVRPTGQTPAADATGIAPQVRQRLLSGDLSGALALVKALPADQQAGLKAFTDAVAQRIAAQDAVRTIEADALTSTTRKG